ncbi:FliG C-terminal domain-containing protein [Thioclava sp. A2]|nr:FliG C-terminal domain-containing protein [Thioclava sp. A2]MDV7269616.1 FliG C-terminal domain-containing protein [Thioclava sp. A2]
MRLTRKQKAAVIVRLLSSEGVKIPLNTLTDDQQEELAQEIADLRLIDRDTLHAVVAEFCEQLEAVGLAFPGGIDGALSILDGQLSPSAATRLRRMASGTSRADPWERLTGLAPEALAPVLEFESSEVCAVVLSKLSVAKAADLLGRMPGEKARRIAYAVSLTGNVAPETVHRIGLALAAQLDAQPARAFDTGPVERVGAILNYSASSTRDDVLKGLEEEDQAFAEQVKKAIFTFTNIPARIDPRDIPKILRALDQQRLVVALAGAKGEGQKSVEFILANMSQRMAQNLREEMQNLGKVKDKDAEDAAGELVNAIRELEAAGEIFLVAEDEE